MTPEFFDKKSNKLLGDGDSNGFSQIGVKIKTKGPGLEIKNMWILYDIQERHRRSGPNNSPVEQQQHHSL